MVRPSWTARLDARGYHKLSVTRPDLSTRWDGPTTSSEEGGRIWVDGEAVVVFDPKDKEAELRLCKGDAVYLKGKAKGKPAEIALIVDIFADDKGWHWLGVKFFWRPEHMNLPDDLDWHERELFLQVVRNKEENWTALVELVPVVVKELDDPGEFPDPPAPHHFFYRRAFDPKTNELIELAPPAPPVTPAQAAQAAMDVDGPATVEPPRLRLRLLRLLRLLLRLLRLPRRNENKERLAALEAQVAELSTKAARADALSLQVADLCAKLEAARAEIDALGSRVAQLGVYGRCDADGVTVSRGGMIGCRFGFKRPSMYRCSGKT